LRAAAAAAERTISSRQFLVVVLQEKLMLTSNPQFQARKMDRYPAFNLAPASIARSQ
jgi:hypothetical protein